VPDAALLAGICAGAELVALPVILFLGGRSAEALIVAYPLIMTMINAGLANAAYQLAIADVARLRMREE